jgi:hypothetical protein
MAHAEGTAGIKAAVRAGVDSIEHGTMLDEEGAALMEKRGTWLVPTLSTFQRGVEMGTNFGQDPISLAKGKEILKYQQPAFALALKHHLKIAFGLDDDPDFLPKEFEALVRGADPVECPACHGSDVERLLSTFALSTDERRQAAALDSRRRQIAKNRDKVIADEEYRQKHDKE